MKNAKKKQNDPKIQEEDLEHFVMNNIKKKDESKIDEIRQSFLWDRDGIERYRINVWTTNDSKDDIFKTKKIGYSFFVHFDVESGEIKDATVKSNSIRSI